MSELDYRRFPVLIVDDEPDILSTFRLAHKSEFTVLCAENGSDGLEILEKADLVAVTVADQRMPGMAGVEFLRRAQELRPGTIRIILTGYADIEVLIDAVNGSRIYRYVTKPWDTQEMRVTLKRAIEAFHLTQENERLLAELQAANERLAGENAYLRDRDGRTWSPDGLIGSAPAMVELFRLLDKVAPSAATVLIEGETGTGKELVASAIHRRSPRAERLFVPVNCAALSESLLESELFGHRRGAFTGALSDRKGLFEVASGGTIFLDEIGETTPALQTKLLRVLQEGEILPVGETRPRKIDVRVVAATNRKLEDEVRAGRFREDLYYRLRVFPVRVPPLRERRGDIPELARYFLDKHAPGFGKRVSGISPAALDALGSYAFPGNVRELQNEIERAILLAEPGQPIGVADLSEAVLGQAEDDGPPDDDGAGEVRTPAEDVGTTGSAGTGLRERTDAFERAQIDAALTASGGNRTHAARSLGMTYRGLLKKMQRLGMGG